MEPPTGLTCLMLAAVETVRQYIDLHPLEQKSIDYFCDKVVLNRKTLQRAFKFKYGFTVSEYQQKKRIEKAASLMLEGRLTLKQIAKKCGYHKDNNFSRAFKKAYKKTPTEWQYVSTKQLGNNDSKTD
jgi:AraC-like DNA-binding protein